MKFQVVSNKYMSQNEDCTDIEIIDNKERQGVMSAAIESIYY